eukprot:scaffold922_cov327-Pinguiococcus_pyrenoidosus.AAC.21
MASPTGIKKVCRSETHLDRRRRSQEVDLLDACRRREPERGDQSGHGVHVLVELQRGHPQKQGPRSALACPGSTPHRFSVPGLIGAPSVSVLRVERK